MATPFIAGEAALILSLIAQQRSQIDVTAVIESSTVSIEAENPSYGGLLGVGRPDVASAVGSLAAPTSVNLHATEAAQGASSPLVIVSLTLILFTILVVHAQQRSSKI